ncbi:MAG: NAD(P)H-dependent oxidoreductase [Vampirovibrionales bacterium]|nr:NAD(P)H-dependent oxidoreductase [Vampirovibrionales bacterium]
MTATPKVLVFAGSARKASLNKKLARLAAESLQQQGVEATFIDLADFEMPIYDGDWEDTNGLPENAKKLKKLFLEHQGLLIAAPEYNSSMTPLLKNTLDWVSRTETDDEPSLSAYRGKVAALVATSPGGFGGLRGLIPLRMMLENIQVMVIPQQLAVAKGFEAFDASGALANPGVKQQLDSVTASLAAVLKKLA